MIQRDIQAPAVDPTDPPLPAPRPPRRMPWAARGLIAVIVLIGCAVVYVANEMLTDRFVDATRVRAELRQQLYAGAILSELQRNSVVPLLLARDQSLIAALKARDFSASSRRLISFVDEIGAAAITLADMDGRIVAATDRERLGADVGSTPAFTETVDTTDTVFTLAPEQTGAYGATFSRVVRDGAEPLGVLTVAVDLAQFESRWRGTTAAVVVTDAGGTVILTTEPRWRGKTVEAAIESLPVPSALERALNQAPTFTSEFGEPLYASTALMTSEARIPFRGWRLVSFTSYESVRERVNGVLALIITGFAILLAVGFYFATRRAELRSLLFERESVALRKLNARLRAEIAERRRLQGELAETEQSLAQSSKLAVLGEMSAAVSHELNQPLAAMKTYLAGAKLLLQRRRAEEAMSSFQRIDDLIERMGAITRQLKSYARKGDEAFEPFDLRRAVSGAMALMEPQLRQEGVRLTQSLPPNPVPVHADRLRIEQVVINLVRNAVDAMRGADTRALDVMLDGTDSGDGTGEAMLRVRDTGHGIDDPDQLFEPFYTTKRPGEGVGLGLAISSGIVKDHGGRLTARNRPEGGAVFEVRLPRAIVATEAAE